MATLALAAAGSALGGAVGGGILGVSAAMIGQGVGAAIGSAIDRRLFAPGQSPVSRDGPRLERLDVMTSQEGTPLPEVAGRTAVAGSVIWAARLREVQVENRERVGSGKQKQTVTSTSYEYYASFAVALGEGPIRHFGRIWADGRLWDFGPMLNAGQIRMYRGGEDQEPDPKIAAVEGSAPAYRGTAYVVFEDLPLSDFGNRVPQIRVEVFGQSGEMERLITGVNIIPGSTEWGYLPRPVRQRELTDAGEVKSERAENTNRYPLISDWRLSMDQMANLLPKAETASLIVAWFGTDLRAGLCRVEPRIEFADKDTSEGWRVAGRNRRQVPEVSRVDGRPAYGSTPADVSVVEAIRDLRRRGKRVVLYPFVMMDVPVGADLPAPSGGGVQGAYPWRGRIEPRAGQDVAAEVEAFMGGEWGFRRFILHLADLAAEAGGADAFLVGSEMRGLSMARAGDGSYPFVDALRGLAAEVRTRLPGAKISYAADWSEYHSDRGGDDIRFHLDPFWADPNCDFVGIDNYLPLSDWRPDDDHADLDHAKGVTSPYSLDYLKGNIEGGEYWDWYYPTYADRVAQNRVPITDGAHNEPWVYRQKAIRDWQSRAHHERIDGVRQSARTAWVPGSKPVWFTELGCPAVDNGPSRPNVFVARTSSESALPYFSAGTRDDYAQRQFLRASMEWWRDNGGDAVDWRDIQVWCWDARPWPEFPQRSSIWSDGGDWRLGHWLNGRAGAAPAAETIERRLVGRHGLPSAEIDVAECHGQADGYAAPGPLSARDFVQPFEVALGVIGREAAGRLAFLNAAHARRVAGVEPDQMVEADGADLYSATRSDIVDVPRAAIIRFRDGVADYRATAIREAIETGREFGESEVETPLVLDFDRGHAAVVQILRSAADGRERLTFRAPRSMRHLQPGVIVSVALHGGSERLVEVMSVREGADLQIEARSFVRTASGAASVAPRQVPGGPARPSTSALLVPLDLPAIDGLPEGLGHFAAHSRPWPGSIGIARSRGGDIPYTAHAAVGAPATVGELIAPLDPGQPWTWTEGPLDLDLLSGSLQTRTAEEVLAGANGLAVLHEDGVEVVQFRAAEITAEGWRLTGLLRGQRGTDYLSGRRVPKGAKVVLLGRAVTSAGVASGEVGRAFWYRYGPPSIPVEDHRTLRHAFRGVSARPFAPVHVRGRHDDDGLTVTWARRSRSTAGTWAADGRDMPLGEDRERYRVEVRIGGEVVRSETVASPRWRYSPAARSADGDPGSVRVAVAQVSETFGPGPASALTWEF